MIVKIGWPRGRDTELDFIKDMSRSGIECKYIGDELENHYALYELKATEEQLAFIILKHGCIV